MNIIARILPAGLLALPVLVAGNTADFAFLDSVVAGFGNLVATLIPILIALAFLVFVWGLISFILASGDEAAKEEGKRRMIWGVIALFVITAIWGILALLRNLTDTNSTDNTYPTWPVS
jgi:uncharacterized membrane protein